MHAQGTIAIVVPTIRPESFQEFIDSWKKLLVHHRVHLIRVEDGKDPLLSHFDMGNVYPESPGVIGKGNHAKYILGKDADLVYNFNDGVRNLGFAYVAKELHNVEYIITLDDDVRPLTGTDPIQEHIDVLNTYKTVSWVNTASIAMRGLPYDVREEAEVVLSHGVWKGVPDLDAVSQLSYNGKIPDIDLSIGAIPKGILFPMCIMNVAFKRKMLPYMYQAPAYGNYQRFSDIWGGINAKRAIDKNGWAAVTGYSTILHERASNVYTNLQKEARGIMLNEKYWKGEMDTMDAVDQDYFNNYHEKMKRWEKLITKWIK